jgi:peptide/nickel transport system permease protein
MTTTTETTPTTEVPRSTDGLEVASRSAWQLFWARFKEDRVAVFGGMVIIVLVFLAFFGGPIAAQATGHSNTEIFPSRMLDDFGLPRGPNNDFWFGADETGRDLFVRVMYGARTSLIVGVVASGIALLVGLVVGLIAGFYGGWSDTILSRSADVMLALPQLLIAIGIVAACGVTVEGCHIGFPSIPLPFTDASTPGIHFFNLTPGLGIVIGVIALFTWPYVARIVRGYTLSLREREFVEASRSLGATNRRIIFREVLPNLIGPIIVYGTLLIPQAILFEAALSYLGLGVGYETASWGGLLNQASNFYEDAWWLMLFPGILLVMTVLAFNLLGDGLRDALDVRADR